MKNGVCSMDQVWGIKGSFWRKVGIGAVLLILSDILLFDSGGGTVLGVFMAAFALLSAAAHRAGWHKGWSLAAFALAIILAAAMAWDPSFLALVLFAGMVSLAVLLPTIKGAGDGWYWFKRLAFHGVVSPFNPLIDLNRFAKARRRKGERLSITRIIPVLVLPLIGSGLFLGLFAMANPIISDFLGQIQIGSIDENDVARLFFWGIMAIIIWSTLRPWRAKVQFRQLSDSTPTRIAGVSVASVTLSLVMFNLLFGLQNGLDLVYLWGGQLPENFTLAEYAHRGAYPLVATALLAGLFIIVTTHPKSALAADKVIRGLVILWIAQNLLLLASTVERTLLYIDSYSLTRLRIAALLWMGLVGFGLVLVTWRMLRGRSLAWLVNGNVLAAFAVLATCTFADLGATAAHWNVRHAEEVGGKGVNLDLCYLNQLDGSAIGALASLEQRQDLAPMFRQRVVLVRGQVQRRLEAQQMDRKSWRWRDAPRLTQLRHLGLKDLTIPKGYYVACNGELLPIGERYSDEADYERY
jgi:Domain of unknown function (DUF4173)